MGEVKSRVYGRESTFSEVHRKLGTCYPLTDIDFMQGELVSGFVKIGFADMSENHRYYEYKTDFETVKVKVSALFDCKYNATPYVLSTLLDIKVGSALWAQIDLARQLGARSFVVIATDGSLPLQFYETTTGAAVLCGILKNDEVSEVRRFWRNVLRL